MKLKITISILLICSILVGCGSKGAKQQVALAESIPTINLSEGNVRKVQSLPLSDAVQTVDIVPLEVTDASILSDISDLQVTASDIWVKTYKDQAIFRFSRSGKFLNKVGKIGQGPEEYTRLWEFVVDDEKKEVTVISTISGVKVYDYEGNYIGRRTPLMIDKLTNGAETQFVNYQQQTFIFQNLPIVRPINHPKDSLWSIALADDSFRYIKLWKNPSFIGREGEIVEHRSKPESYEAVNYWSATADMQIDKYNQELTLKYPDTDSIYQYDTERKDFVVQYAITSDYPKGDYGEVHLWIKPRKTFNYFTIRNYYQSKDYIYLKANKGEEIYHYAYNKKDGTVRRAVRQGKLVERKLPWFSQPYIGFMNGIPDAFSNDICGGYFQMDYRSAGCWVEVITPEPEAIAERIKNIETSEALNATQKEEYLKVLREMNEDSNQTLVIANLK